MKIIEKIKAKAQNPMDRAPVKIAFLGDSVTHGCFEVVNKRDGNVDCLYDHAAGYPNRLRQKIETVFPNCPVSIINAGISGGTAPVGAQRLARDVISCDPDLVIVCFGLNDCHQEAGIPAYLDGLRSIFSQLQEKNIDCIFMTPNMMCSYVQPDIPEGWLRDMAIKSTYLQNEGIMDAFMEAAVKLCSEMEVTVCDCYRDWKRMEQLHADTTYLLSNFINHPTREMHALFAERLFYGIFFQEDNK